MTTALTALREANQTVLARLAEREKQLSDRERTLTDELTAIENERRLLSADRETIQKAGAIQARMLGSVSTTHPAVSNTAGESKPDGGQVRARIGPQRYAMLVALRDYGSLTVEEIAEITGLNIGRVREQMRIDQPNHVNLDIGSMSGPGGQKLLLTIGGANLLDRFESYRRSQGKPLPTLNDPDDSSDDDAAKVGADNGDAEAQTNEAVGNGSPQDAPTASVEDDPAREFFDS